MIVSLLFFFSYLCELVKTKLNKKIDNNESVISVFQKLSFEGEAEFVDQSVQFFPPVYIQRYRAVCEVLRVNDIKGSIRKIVDFGCSELGFFCYIKRIEAVEEYFGVDIDKETLVRNCSKTSPLPTDYLCKRSTPFKVNILRGSVSDHDSRLQNSNAVIAIELIEHMYPDELNELPYNIFGFIQPEIAIFTTPNVEFNIIFKTLVGFRHLDHKFEWTRSQFEDWARNVTIQYPQYDVTFHGIGIGPQGTEELGCCSQMATFVKKSTDKVDFSEDVSEIYESIYETEHPFQTVEDKFKDLVEYEIYHIINDLSHVKDFIFGEQLEIPLDFLTQKLSVECSVEILKDLLKGFNKEVVLKNNKDTLIEPYYDQDRDYSSSCSSNDIDNSHSVQVFNDDDNCLYWDNPLNDAVDENMKSEEVEDKNTQLPEEKLTSKGSVINETWNEIENLQECSTYMELCHSPNSVSIESTLEKSMFSNASKQIEFENETDKTQKCTGAIPKNNGTSAKNHSLAVSNGNSHQSELSSRKPDTKVDVIEALLPSHSSATTSLNDETSNCPGCINCTDLKFHHSFIENNCIANGGTSKKCLKEARASSNSISQTLYVNTDYLNITHHKSEATTNGSHRKLVGFAMPEQSINKIQLEDAIPEIADSIENSTLVNAAQNKNHYDHVKRESPEQSQSSSSFVHRCHSLENVNINNSKNKSFRYSLNIDNKLDSDTSIVDMDLEICCKGSSVPSLTDTLGSHSKAPDSGYPNSSHDMEMDLTPEQVDEIITESESSLEDEDSSADERIEQVLGNPPVVFLDNVENGDVANNNRDGEGNNMEGGEAGQEMLGFEGLVLEGEDIEAGQHDSDDEGLYLSALDVSNETLVPEESSSHEEIGFASLLDFPSSSSSSFLRPFDEFEIRSPEDHIEFPAWLLDISVNVSADSGPSSGDGDHGVHAEQSFDTVIDVDAEEPEITVPGDTMGGGEGTQRN